MRRKSKSFGHLLEGDKISRIGGRSVDGLSHDEAMALVDSHQDKLDIEIIRYVRYSSRFCISEFTGMGSIVGLEPATSCFSVRDPSRKIS